MELIGKNKRFIILVLILQMKHETEIQAKIFNSIAALEPLIETQSRVIKSIEAYLTAERKQINFIKDYINYSEQRHMEAINDTKYYWHLLRAYSLMNRVDRGFGFIVNFTRHRTGYVKDTRLLYPSREDYIGAIDGIVRLQTTYGLSITQLANGTLVSNFSQSNKLYVENVTPMTSEDCFTLGLVDHKVQGFLGRLLWMKQALKKYYEEKCEICNPTEEKLLVHKIGEAYYNLGEFERALKWTKRYLALKPVHRRKEDEIFLRELQEKVVKEGHKTRKELNRARKQPRLSHLYGCYENLKPNRANFRLLQCGFNTRSSYMRLQPVKTEVLSVAPYVYLFHDVISDSEINALLESAQPNRMIDAGFYKLVEGKPQINRNSDYRVAKSISLDKSCPLAVKLNQRIADVIDIDRKSNVSLIVSNYGIGGFYGQHVDNLGYITDTSFPDGEGDRLFAFVYFLSEVEQGGALVFPDLGVKVYPKKGAALAWDTLLPSGDGELTASHTACPVIRGSRWTAVNWIKQVDIDKCPKWHVQDGLMSGEKYMEWKRKYKEAENKLHKRLRNIFHY